ncbi:MAG: hypothetical protein LQ337_001141 [Flavoplaca oasis]|nr:MAG: hypothetical protein LQ337_001141 [Flavoplaca oasis]
MSSTTPLKVGVLLCSTTQLMDVAPLDMLGMIDKFYAQSYPEHIAANALEIKYYFVNETGESPHSMTGGFKLAVTHSISSCPPLDILLIGGPPPTYRPSEAVQHFIRTQYQHVRHLLTICTGYTPALYSGVLDGKTATAPRGLLPMLKEEKPDVKWVEKRWVRDGKVWSSGAVANGMDMMACFMKEEFKEQGALTEMAMGMADFVRRGEAY